MESVNTRTGKARTDAEDPTWPGSALLGGGGPRGIDPPLEPDTEYRVRYHCTGPGLDTWSEPVTFRALAPAPPPEVPDPGIPPSVANPYTGRDWTASWGGVLLGDGSSVVLEEVAGLLDAPEVRTSDAELLQRDGLTPGTDYMGARTVTLTMLALDEREVPALLAAFAPGGPERPFEFAFPPVAGGRSRILARVRKRAVTVDREYHAGRRRFTVELAATDPRLYGAWLQSATVAVDVPRGGRPIFPLTFPFDMGNGPAARSTPDIANTGSVETWPLVRLTPRTGEIRDPALTLVNGGVRRRFATRGLRVGRGDALVIDMGRRRITLNGASRFGQVDPGSAWFALPPGPSAVQLDVLEGPDGVTADVQWRSAWM
ncbi:phage tail domain-containing protein [Kitasatospora sp. NBC_01287]|uniref:phage distal tail protein n=1 Tax=Kitasatospora sp. NBC_01287 TaxID=2903573 RepID=UPI002254CF4F|nr:phage tail domain-containing protein [Kitasatospora sp. NBC_01287]